MLGSSRCSSTHSAVTSAVSRLMFCLCFLVFSGAALSLGVSGVGVHGSAAGGCDTADQQGQLAAQAEAEDCVQQCRREGETGRDGSEERRAGEVADQADRREDQAAPLAERGGRRNFGGA